MAVRTKQPQLIDAQLNISKVVYFKIGNWFRGVSRTAQGELPVWQFEMIQYYIDDNGNEKLLKSSPVIYRQSTFNALFGSLSFLSFESQMDDLMIQQIDYVNKQSFTGSELMYVKYWDLESTDLEKVV